MLYFERELQLLFLMVNFSYIFKILSMGVYLSEPNTTKNTAEGKLNKMSFVSVEMQGWRKNMEDAVIHELDIGDGNCVFAVFDGHGGPEVS